VVYHCYHYFSIIICYELEANDVQNEKVEKKSYKSSLKNSLLIMVYNIIDDVFGFIMKINMDYRFYNSMLNVF